MKKGRKGKNKRKSASKIELWKKVKKARKSGVFSKKYGSIKKGIKTLKKALFWPLFDPSFLDVFGPFFRFLGPPDFREFYKTAFFRLSADAFGPFWTPPKPKMADFKAKSCTDSRFATTGPNSPRLCQWCFSKVKKTQLGVLSDFGGVRFWGGFWGRLKWACFGVFFSCF
jgi:hypothetical protein